MDLSTVTTAADRAYAPVDGLSLEQYREDANRAVAVVPGTRQVDGVSDQNTTGKSKFRPTVDLCSQYRGAGRADTAPE